MAASRFRLLKGAGCASPDTLVLLLLAAWWVVNLLQAAFTGLANDEAYYLYYSRRLDWGYFDHPPMVALLVAATSWVGGSIGLRLASTVLQPLYLLLFWHLIKPAGATRRDAVVYVLLCFSQPLLQLYGFMALPDAPLMMSTVLFLWAYKRLCASQNVLNATLLGVCIALLGYSKYHGALVVAAAMVANPRLLRRWHLYYAAALGLLLLSPHLWWQWRHDWVSMRYHLSGRNAAAYRASFTLEYLLLLLFIFNPLWLWHYVKALFGRAPRTDADGTGLMLRRALWAVALVFVLFFLPNTRNGHVQPQWLLPVTLPCVALLFDCWRGSRYVLRAGLASMVLMLAARLLAAVGPSWIKGELWHQREQYEAIAAVADGRPVVFMHTYTAPCKYTFYTGSQAYCAPYYFNRHSQWQYDTADRALRGQEVVVGNFTNRQADVLPLGMGGGYRAFHYSVVSSYQPTRELVATPDPAFEAAALPGESFSLGLDVANPYGVDIAGNDSSALRVTLYFEQSGRRYSRTFCRLEDTLRAGSTTHLDLGLDMPRSLADGTAEMGVSIGQEDYTGSDTGPRVAVCVSHRGDTIAIKTLKK
ncbi:MAG: glycosyltransferase family 39 protein [Bacteroidales bacterium]|nr:glycosyltransferase family 39 protein [Bacteroidales bacterium]